MILYNWVEKLTNRGCNHIVKRTFGKLVIRITEEKQTYFYKKQKHALFYKYTRKQTRTNDAQKLNAHTVFTVQLSRLCWNDNTDKPILNNDIRFRKPTASDVAYDLPQQLLFHMVFYKYIYWEI